jgi:hypothetical protein
VNLSHDCGLSVAFLMAVRSRVASSVSCWFLLFWGRRDKRGEYAVLLRLDVMGETHKLLVVCL